MPDQDSRWYSMGIQSYRTGRIGIDVNLSNMDVNADLESLQLFNEKAEELRQSTFAARAFSPGTGITISMGVDKPLQVERRGPDDENLRAFVLTLRFFVQNNEQCSLHNLERTYERLPTSADRKHAIKDARAAFNDFLDRPSFVQFRNQKITHRRIMEVFLYGSLAHMSKAKRDVLNSWKANAQLWPIMYDRFVAIVSEALRCISYLERLNRETLEELKQLLQTRKHSFPLA